MVGGSPLVFGGFWLFFRVGCYAAPTRREGWAPAKPALAGDMPNHHSRLHQVTPDRAQLRKPRRMLAEEEEAPRRRRAAAGPSTATVDVKEEEGEEVAWAEVEVGEDVLTDEHPPFDEIVGADVCVLCVAALERLRRHPALRLS